MSSRTQQVQPGSVEASILKNKSAHSHMPQFLVNSQSIKPSSTFMNLERSQMKFNSYVDMKNGPSTLQKRADQPTLCERNLFSFEHERLQHAKSQPANLTCLEQAKSKLQNPDTSLRQPKDVRDEIKEIRRNLDRYHAHKT
jgi:hypothetical protein